MGNWVASLDLGPSTVRIWVGSGPNKTHAEKIKFIFFAALRFVQILWERHRSKTHNFFAEKKENGIICIDGAYSSVPSVANRIVIRK